MWFQGDLSADRTGTTSFSLQESVKMELHSAQYCLRVCLFYEVVGGRGVSVCVCVWGRTTGERPVPSPSAQARVQLVLLPGSR